MTLIELHTVVGENGILNLELPKDLSNQEVVVRVEVVAPSQWSPSYFEETYGSFADNSLERDSQ